VPLITESLELRKDQEPQTQVDGRQVDDFHGEKRNAEVMGALFRSSGFLVALLVGSGTSLLALVAPRSRRSVVFGVAIFAAVLAGLRAEDVLKSALPAGLLLLAAGALACEGRPLILRVAALAPGAALLVTLAADGSAGWARALAFVTVIGVGPVATGVDRRFPYLTIALFAASALGAYATVPDTEQAVAVVGALVVVAVFAVLWRSGPDSFTPALGVSLVAWVALVGGVGRSGSVVGAIGCLGVFGLGPLTRRNSAVRVVIVHLAVVAFASRVAGLRQSAWVAAAVLVPVLAIVAVLLASGERGWGRQST
jgi:hypothetical protein